jgi:hypothetical protein
MSVPPLPPRESLLLPQPLLPLPPPGEQPPSQPHKRRRLIVDQEEEEEEEEEHALTGEASMLVDQPAPPKRKPGRPRKQPVANTTANTLGISGSNVLPIPNPTEASSSSSSSLLHQAENEIEAALKVLRDRNRINTVLAYSLPLELWKVTRGAIADAKHSMPKDRRML